MVGDYDGEFDNWALWIDRSADRIEQLTAEVERLQKRLELTPEAIGIDGIYTRDCTIAGLEKQAEQATQIERTAIVSWLTEWAKDQEQPYRRLIERVAEAIKTGEHHHDRG
jgi:hypothetical protein